jgi:hypothetical protein
VGFFSVSGGGGREGLLLYKPNSNGKHFDVRFIASTLMGIITRSNNNDKSFIAPVDKVKVGKRI